MPAPLERSRLGRLNPLSKLTLAGAFLAASSLVFEPRFQLAAILAALMPLILLEGARPLELLWRLWPFALVGLGYLWLNLAFFDRAAAYTWTSAAVPVAQNPALFAGTTLFLRAIALGAISLFFVRTTDPADFLRSLMLRCRLPARWGFALLAAFQFLPGLGEQLRLLRLAQAQRLGRQPQGWAKRLAGYRRLAIPLLADSIRRADRAAIAMEARGLRHPIVRSSLRPSPFSWADGLFLAAGITLLAALDLLLG
jgi:energy-coupling factor transport system permease protein